MATLETFGGVTQLSVIEHANHDFGVPKKTGRTPEEVLDDPQFKDRGFPVDVEHADLGKTFVYPGAPYRFTASPWRISRRAPHLGEHNESVLGALGVSADELAQLRSDGVV